MQTLLFDDTFDIYRMAGVVGADKITRQSSALMYSCTPGHLSRSGDDKTGGPTTDANDIKTDYILFCAPDIDIKPGDTILIRGLSCLAGLPHRYQTHMQTPLEYKGEA